MEGNQEASLSWFKPGVIARLLYLNLNLGWPRGFSIMIWMEGNQKASLSWLEPGLFLQKTKVWNYILEYWCFIVLLFWDVWFFFFSLLFFFEIWISSSKGKPIDFFYEVLWKILFHHLFFYWNLKFSLESDTLCSWSSLRKFLFPFLQNWNFIEIDTIYLWKYLKSFFFIH